MEREANSLFFGIEAVAPWPHSFPKGRLIHEGERHATLAFLGKVDWSKLSPLLSSFPKPEFKVGLAGIFDKTLFLPKRHPHVVSWHIEFFETLVALVNYQKQICNWLIGIGFPPHSHEDGWLPHVTLARQHFDLEAWKAAFTTLPVFFNAIHLYESVGNLRYTSLWSFPLPFPWTEIEHTADIAFIIRGQTLQQIYRHALLALAFKFPQLLSHLPVSIDPTSLDDVIILLNEAISLADQAVGCPFKAVSFHGELENFENILYWEMIVDV
jgi:2'-5' RNA ligase